MRDVLTAVWLFSATAGVTAAAEQPSDHQRHVVITVWDGMRPDFITAERAPTLWKMGQQGVIFRNHHSVYFSATNVNGAAIATGMYPAHTGLIANHEFRPLIDGRKPVDVENPRVVSKGDELSHGNYIAAPTIAELVQKAGGRTVIAGSKTVGLLHDRPRQMPFGNNSVTVSAGEAWPNDAIIPIVKALGRFPKAHEERDVWTTKALTEILWKDGVPPFSVLWLGEPDLTQHQTAPGTPAALHAIKASDANLAGVLAALDRHHVRQSTDVLVVSDHGFSTIEREVELPRILLEGGFDVSTEFRSDPEPGEIMMVGGGGSVLFYVVQHQAAAIARLVGFLQKSDFAGVIFTRQPMEGTFALARAEIDTADAPDVVLSFRWNDQPNQYGVHGMIDADWQRGAGKGTHATLSPFDMHNTLVAAGPDFHSGQPDDLPTGNVDLAPTVLHILQITAPSQLDGRVLTEALVNGGAVAAKPETETIEASRQFSDGTWRQTLRLSHVDRTTYIDEGNGVFAPRK